MAVELIGGASTQSRGQRPLLLGAIGNVTLYARGVHETTRYDYPDGHSIVKENMLSWIGGQAGLLRGSSSFRALFFTHGSYGHRVEYDLAETLGEVYATYLSTDDLGVRFFQSGGEANAAAVRIARAATGIEQIASYGYHGMALEFAHEPASRGQPRVNVELCKQFEWGDVKTMWNTAKESACVIVEVPALDNDEAIALFLHECRMACNEYSIPLILDEVVTGFRFGLAGACERYHVKPDMVVLGKAMSNVGVVSAVLGRRDLMQVLTQGCFASTTFGGHPGLCAIADETIRYLIEHRAEVYEHLSMIGRALKDGFNERGIPCIGQPERSIFAFQDDTQWLEFCVKMLEQNVIVHRPNFPTLAHTPADVEETMRALEEIKRLET